VTCFSFYRGKTKAALFTVLSAWDEQRAALQARSLRRQMDRLTTAALHAQLCDPQPLPTITADSALAYGG